MKDTIFVSIACFMDKDIINTIKSCVDNAKYPDRIKFVICLQYDLEDDWKLEDPTTYEKKTCPNISITKIHWKNAQGPTYARYLCNQLIKNNSDGYFLQIDCHSRFIKNWDVLLIESWKECVEKAKHNKVILSMFPIAINNMNKIDTAPLNISSRRFQHLNEKSIKLSSIQCSDKNPRLTYYLSGAFIFGPISFTKEVPYDPILTYSYQSVEQQFYAIRLYTHGWDIYKPSRHVLGTSYTRSKHFDMKGNIIYAPSNQLKTNLSWDRVLYYYGLKSLNDVNPEYRKDIHKYGLGKIRSLQSFFEIHNEPNWKNKIYPDMSCTFLSKNNILNKILSNNNNFKKSTTDNIDFLWDYNYRFVGLNKNKLHHYPMNTVNFIDNKKIFFKMLNNEGIRNGIPKTYFSINEIPENLGKRLYLKYAGNNGGKNVFLYDNINDLKKDIRMNNDPYILQEEVYPMFLMEERKFVLRNWVVIIGNKFYLFINGTCILHGDKYIKDSLDRSINIDHIPGKIKYVKYENTDFYSKTFTKIIKLLSRVCIDGVKKNIIMDDNSFQVLGTDIIFSSNLDPYLIEINSWPNMSDTNVKQSCFFDYFVTDLLVPYMKFKHIPDKSNFISL